MARKALVFGQTRIPLAAKPDPREGPTTVVIWSTFRGYEGKMEKNMDTTGALGLVDLQHRSPVPASGGFRFSVF